MIVTKMIEFGFVDFKVSSCTTTGVRNIFYFLIVERYQSLVLEEPRTVLGSGQISTISESVLRILDPDPSMVSGSRSATYKERLRELGIRNLEGHQLDMLETYKYNTIESPMLKVTLGSRWSVKEKDCDEQGD